MQISTKLIIAFLLASLAPLAVIGALSYFNAKEDLTQQVLSHLESVAAIQRNGVENIVNQNLERLAVVAGLIHDIGKIGVRESILSKPARLTVEEFQHIKDYCEMGEYILVPIMDDREILGMVRNHRERYNGSGYPDGLSEEQIPLGARILAVADAYDAMTSERPYRRAMSPEAACSEIEEGKGIQFDPKVAEAFFRARESLVSVVGQRCD